MSTPSPSPAVREIAATLIEREMEATGPEARAVATERVVQRLCLLLSPLIGVRGFDMVLNRSLTRSRVDLPLLANVKAHAESHNALSGLRETLKEHPEQAERTTTGVVADFLGLLAKFIGYDVMLALLRREWPTLVNDGDGVRR